MAKSISEETIRAIKASDRADYQRKRKIRRIVILFILIAASVACWVWAYRQIQAFRHSLRELGPMRVLICTKCSKMASVYCMDPASAKCEKCGASMALVLKCKNKKCGLEFPWVERPVPTIKDKIEFIKALDNQRACPKCKSTHTVQILPSDDEAPPPPGSKGKTETASKKN